jgi:hypothetical protein
VLFRSGCRAEEIIQRQPALAGLVQRRCWRKASRQGRRKISWAGGRLSREVIKRRLNRVSYTDIFRKPTRRSARRGLVPAIHPRLSALSLLCLPDRHHISDHDFQHQLSKVYSVSRFRSAFGTQMSPSACSTTRGKATFMATCQSSSPSVASS